MIIKDRSWKKFIEDLRKLSEKAAELTVAYMETHDYSTSAGRQALIEYAYAVATKYGEGATEKACQMYDAVAEKTSPKPLPPAEPAQTATYQEVGKAVNGTMLQSVLPVMVGMAIGRLVKMAGVDTTLNNAIRDGAEWAWISIGDSCPYCLGLASEGWSKASKNALKNGHASHIHANCDCTYAVRHDGKSSVDGYDPEAIEEQFEEAEGKTVREKANFLRRQRYAANAEMIREQKRVAYARHKVALHTYDDPIREKLGSAENSHPERLREILAILKDNGVEVERRAGMSYQPSPTPGKPGKVIMEDGASISAWEHELKHFEDDKASGYIGFRMFADPQIAAELEADAYDIEIEFAKQLGYNDIVKRLEEIKVNRLKDFEI